MDPAKKEGVGIPHHANCELNGGVWELLPRPPSPSQLSFPFVYLSANKERIFPTMYYYYYTQHWLSLCVCRKHLAANGLSSQPASQLPSRPLLQLSQLSPHRRSIQEGETERESGGFSRRKIERKKGRKRSRLKKAIDQQTRKKWVGWLNKI